MKVLRDVNFGEKRIVLKVRKTKCKHCKTKKVEMNKKQNRKTFIMLSQED